MDKKNSEPVDPVILPDVATQAHPSVARGDLPDAATARVQQKGGSEPTVPPNKDTDRTQPVLKKPAADATQ